ncbi:mitochondrial N-acyl-phosphatidylethanolamine-hydrolysing phospholipase D [Andalucia godoyi]|uniref:Mitochondrial N-acyl-phosphatidylethanolamine-hydrolysing phospholipase D n=1 Tax=Andalucia godoyi TaxID=505711 RepID=A0A8K0AHT1_ANDGO|nr:mitochondrial N-acyl-phosphatidylethanolamine-hydrolysing phospholipase D [Andalucia godoyi]|eukprot:ANDGO_06545.mRNA.1 mitochondrial N-acyl-phosphatidylethanolamine-hydrolysing phospholipase D
MLLLRRGLFSRFRSHTKMDPIFDHKTRRFRNPFSTWKDPSTWEAMKWGVSRTPPKFPSQDESMQMFGDPKQNVNVELLKTAPKSLRATWFGHATNYVQFSSSFTLITDPVFSERCSPLAFAGPKRIVAVPLEIEELALCDAVLISHNHYDHLDLQSIKRLEQKFQPVFVCGVGLGTFFTKQCSIPEDRVVELTWWQSARVASSRKHLQGRAEPNSSAGGASVTTGSLAVDVQMVPAQHWSRRSMGDKNQSLWGGFHVSAPIGASSEKSSFYFCGDTGYNPELFVEIGRRCGPIDIAAIPIGAYEPRGFMCPQHVNPKEAVMIHKEANVRQSYGIHWGTFILTDEPLDEPPKETKIACEELGVAFGSEFHVIHAGRSIDASDGPVSLLGLQRKDEAFL